MRTCYIVRHADKAAGDFYNPRLRHQDQPISDMGRQAAQHLCPYFEGKPISAIYVSEYLRTWQTIQPIALERGLTPTIDPRLNEIDNGLFEGKTAAEIQQQFPAEWQAYRERKSDFRFPSGESGAEAQQRIASFLAEKHSQHSDQDILLVSHDGLIRVLMCHIVHLPVYLRSSFRVDTCGIMEITYQPDYNSWRLIRFNQVC